MKTYPTETESNPKYFYRQVPDWLMEKMLTGEIQQTSIILLLYLQFYARGRRNWITMPSYREIRDLLGLSPSTISRSIKELASLGVLILFTKRGERSEIKINLLGATLSEEGATLSEEGATLSGEGATLSEEGATLSEEGATLSEEVQVRISAHDRKKEKKEKKDLKDARAVANANQIAAPRALESLESASLEDTAPSALSISTVIANLLALRDANQNCDCRSP